MSKRVLASLVVVLLAVGLFSAVANAGVEGKFTFDISIKPQKTVIRSYIHSESFKEGTVAVAPPPFIVGNMVQVTVTVTDSDGGVIDDGDTITKTYTFTNLSGGAVALGFVFNAVAPAGYTVMPNCANTVLPAPGTYTCTVTITPPAAGWGAGQTVTTYLDIIVEGTMIPTEITKLDFDWEGLLKLNITISGLTFSNDIALGIAGIEHYIADLSTTLGALDLTDIFVFAAPYNAAGNRLGGLQFVKKKVESEIAIGGLTFKNVILFEDINFDHPYPYPAVQTPSYRFGGWIDISGETVSGIGVRSLTAICADPQEWNKVKKWKELGKVCKSDKLEFTAEKIWITGIPFGPLTIDNELVFKPGAPISLTTTLYFSLLGFDFTGELSTTDITQFPTISSALWTAKVDGFTISWYDNNGTLAVDAAPAPSDNIEGKLVVDIQGTTFTAYALSTIGTGLTDAYFSMSIPVAIGTLLAKVDYSGSPLAMDYYYFKLSSTVAGLGFDIWTKFKMAGMESAGITISVPFSL